jgi:hypothetical protein
MLWFLAREVLRIRGTIARSEQWNVMPDLFFYRDQEDQAKEEPVVVAETHETYDATAAVPGETTDWAADTQIGQNVQLQGIYASNEEWNGPDDNWNRGAAVQNWENTQTNWQ